MIVGLFPMVPLAKALPALVLEHLPVFLLLLLLGVSASQQAREGEPPRVLVGAVLGGLVAAPIPMLWVTFVWLSTGDALAWVFYVSTPPILWVAGFVGAVLGAAVAWLIRGSRARGARS
jgi:hypothetical protein